MLLAVNKLFKFASIFTVGGAFDRKQTFFNKEKCYYRKSFKFM